MRDLSSTVWDTLLIKASSPEANNMQKQTQNYAEKVAARGARTHTRPTLRVGISGPGQVSPAEGQRSGSENGTGHSDLLGPTGTALTNSNMRPSAILQAGQNVQSRHQENQAEHRVSGETAPRFRSTRSNRGRVQVWTVSAHSHGTRAADPSGGSSEGVKIKVKAFLAEEGVQENSKAWHNAMQSEHVYVPQVSGQDGLSRSSHW